MRKLKISEILDAMKIKLEEPLLEIIELLEKRKEIPEEKIADKLGVKVNTARKMLYQLSAIGFVDYKKERDPKRKWWYIYYWFLDRKRILDKYKQYKIKLLEQKKRQLEQEKKFSFICPVCRRKFTYVEAVENDFVCPDDDEVLKEIKINREITKLKKEIALLEKEISQLTTKVSKRPAKRPKTKRAKKKTAARKSSRKKR